MYLNPIISGFYPDPSVCRVGDDYYLVTSSFEYYPAIPIFHSTDLVNWTRIGACVTNPEYLPFEKFTPSGGVWAPTIRYAYGRFYVACAISGFGNMIVSAQTPLGPWSRPVWVNMGGIDPTLLFDGDDVYFATNDNLGTGREAISAAKVNQDTGELLTEPTVIWNGTGGGWLEAPHLYHIGGWYYLLCAEGGTGLGHMATLARCETPLGVYKTCPNNPVLTNRNETTKRVACAGHADIVDDTQGRLWLVHLATRPCINQKSSIGRETFLTPVELKQDGLYVPGGRAKIINDIETAHQSLKEKINYNFASESWEPEWMFLGNRANIKRQNALIMRDMAFAALRQTEYISSLQADISLLSAESEAGIKIYLQPDFYAAAMLTNVNGEQRLKAVYRFDDISQTVYDENADNIVALKAESNRDKYILWAIDKELKKTKLLSISARFFATDTANRCFTGTLFALYSLQGKASFKNVVYISRREV